VTVEPPGFAEAYDDLFLAAWTLARRILGSGSAAEDVAAETMVRAYVHWRRIGDQPWRLAWVLRVATNLALKLVKRSRNAGALVEGWQLGGEEAVVLRDALVAALRALPRRQREVVALRYLADASEADVAGVLGLAPVTVRTHLRRGLAALRLSMGSIPEEGAHG
jgi:RNA polymerase sigma factor (sigma-70 family)